MRNKLDIFDEEELIDWAPIAPSTEIFDRTYEDTVEFEGEADYDDVVMDIDYSEFKGPVKHSLKKIKHKIKHAPKKRHKPLTKKFEVADKGRRTIFGGNKQLNKIIVPEERPVVVEGVSDFILSGDHDEIKNIGYYKGKKLKELIFCINNTSGVDFETELFNPSAPLDFLQATSGNLNDRIAAAGLQTSYSDILHNILANPTLIANARLSITGADVKGQLLEKLTFINKNIAGESVVNPLSLSLNIDLFQHATDTVLFDITKDLNRVFVVDGMDVIKYKVLAGNTITFCFYYKQKSIKKFFFKETRKKKIVLDKMQEIL